MAHAYDKPGDARQVGVSWYLLCTLAVLGLIFAWSLNWSSTPGVDQMGKSGSVQHDRALGELQVPKHSWNRVDAVTSMRKANSMRSESTAVKGVLRFNGVPSQGAVQWRTENQAGSGNTGADGRFSCGDIMSEHIFIRGVPAQFEEASDLCPELMYEISGAEAEIVVDVEIPMTAISGIVVDADWEPVPNVTVVARCTNHAILSSTTTDLVGNWSVSVPGLGTYVITALYGNVKRVVPSVSCDADNVSIQLPNYGVLEVCVTAADTSLPISDPDIYYSSQAVTQLERAVTRELSRRLNGPLILESGSYNIQVRHDRTNRQQQLDTVVIPEDGSTVIRNYALSPAPSVEVSLAQSMCADAVMVVLEDELLPYVTSCANLNEMVQALSSKLPRGAIMNRVLERVETAQSIKGLSPGWYKLVDANGTVVANPAQFEVEFPTTMITAMCAAQ